MHNALRQDLIDIIAGIRDFLGQPVGLEHAILAKTVEKISRMFNDEGQFGQEHDREASPKDGDLAKRGFDPRPQKNERNQHVNDQQACDDQVHYGNPDQREPFEAVKCFPAKQKEIEKITGRKAE